MVYFKTNFNPGKFADEESVLDELLQYNGIFSQVCRYSLDDYEKFIIKNGWLPPGYNFQKLYFEKII